jgi:hypothetical protein
MAPAAYGPVTRASAVETAVVLREAGEKGVGSTNWGAPLMSVPWRVVVPRAWKEAAVKAELMYWNCGVKLDSVP